MAFAAANSESGISTMVFIFRAINASAPCLAAR
jgi:hypothetical protein